MQPRKFPEYLNAPLQVLWWETDDIGLFFTGFLFAMMFGGIFYLIMFVVPYIYGKLKKKYARGFLGHMLIFSGLVQLEGYPSAFEKQFTE